jgi:hypothetical protein
MKRRLLVFLTLALGALSLAQAADTGKTEEDLIREQKIAEFTARMKAANYPALFEAAAKEFNVPADILKGVAFAETRWEHLMWPPGENASPETGMPRPFGIMSLWDNKYFGHSLLEAAALIGKTPDELKQDVYQNIRGGAALLKQIYDANPKPDGTAPADIESWRNAIRKYCGIPEPDLNAQHALDVYSFMNRGYHEYGIEWDAHPVNLDGMRAETKRIVAEEQAKREAQMAANTNQVEVPKPHMSAEVKPAGESKPLAPPPAAPVAVATPAATRSRNPVWIILAVLAVLLGSYLVKRLLRSRLGPS